MQERTNQPSSIGRHATSANAGDLKELVKWEMEVFDRKTEERFKQIEGSLKSNKIKSEDDVGALRIETLGEFENLKG